MQAADAAALPDVDAEGGGHNRRPLLVWAEGTAFTGVPGGTDRPEGIGYTLGLETGERHTLAGGYRGW